MPTLSNISSYSTGATLNFRYLDVVSVDAVDVSCTTLTLEGNSLHYSDITALQAALPDVATLLHKTINITNNADLGVPGTYFENVVIVAGDFSQLTGVASLRTANVDTLTVDGSITQTSGSTSLLSTETTSLNTGDFSILSIPLYPTVRYTATLSGTTWEYTTIPSTCTRFKIWFISIVNTANATAPYIQTGSTVGYTSWTYSGTAASHVGTASQQLAASTSGVPFTVVGLINQLYTGSVDFTYCYTSGTNQQVWFYEGMYTIGTTGASHTRGAITGPASQPLSRVKFNLTSGTWSGQAGIIYS